MTDTQQAQTTETSQTSDQGAAAAAAGAAGAATPPPYYENFKDESLKTNPRFQRLGTVEDVAKSLIHAEKALGLPADQVIRIPSDPNDKDGVRAIYSKLGLPDKPEGYGFDLGDKATDADKTVLAGFQKAAYDGGVTKDQAAPILKWFTDETAKAAEARAQQFEAQRLDGEKVLKSEWGTAFDTKAREIGRLAAEMGGKELAAELTGDKLGNHPQLAKMLGGMLDRMAEPGAPGGRSGEAVGLTAGKLTPTQAKAQLNALETDPVKGKAIFDKTHAQHAEVLKERNRLMKMADGIDPDAA